MTIPRVRYGGSACLAVIFAACALSITMGTTRVPHQQASEELPPEVRWRMLEAAVVDVLRDDLYFGEAIRRRIDEKPSLGEVVRRAAVRVNWSEPEAKAAIARVDSQSGRASLKTLVPEQDDPLVVRAAVRADLLRASAPLADEPRMNANARQRAVSAAIRLLREQMPLPGDQSIWGKVDTELDRKIRSLVASRAAREAQRPWCEFAAWTLLAQGLDERALGIAESSSKWIADANQPASAEFVAVRVIALKALKRPEEAKAALAELKTIENVPTDLLPRVAAPRRS